MYVKELKAILENFEDSDSIAVLFYTRDEFEVSAKSFERAVDEVKLDTADQIMREELETILCEIGADDED